jgi:phosphoglycolate phosphatase
MYNMVIFDLDGTLLDTSPGIYGSVRFAEQVLGLEPVDNSILYQFAGPPPKEMYKKIYGLSEMSAMEAVNAHRKYGMEKAIYEASVYAGMEDTLKMLRLNGMKLAVATLKQQKIAESVLENFHIYHYFDAIVGMDEAESLTKKETIEKVIEYMGGSNAVMVGDSEYDYIGASAANVDFIGVLYGFGFHKNGSYSFKTILQPKDLLPLIITR